MSKASIGLRGRLQGIECHHELQTLHGIQAALESLARLDKGEEGWIHSGLGEQGTVVRSLVKEGGLGEVEEN